MRRLRYCAFGSICRQAVEWRREGDVLVAMDEWKKRKRRTEVKMVSRRQKKTASAALNESLTHIFLIPISNRSFSTILLDKFLSLAV
jgi:hypothetical protein